MRTLWALWLISGVFVFPTKGNAGVVGSKFSPLSDALNESVFDTLRSRIEVFQDTNPGLTLSISEVLKTLPEDFRSGFVALHQSRSMQHASDQFPRILLYGKDAKSVVTFHGDPVSEGYDRLEFAEANPLTGEIVFREMTFPLEDQNNVQKGIVSFSEKNPSKCTACHGTPARYIWNPYSTWPGAYGSRDDVLTRAPKELENWTAFRQSRDKNPRYSQLVIPDEKTEPTAPFRYLDNSDPDVRQHKHVIAIEKRPNFRFGALLMRHQARAAFLKAKQSEFYISERHKLAYLLARCRTGDFQSISLPSQDAQDLLRRLNAPVDAHWRLFLSTEDTNLHRDYNPGVTTFQNAFQWHLWKDLAADQNDLLEGLQEYSFEEVARNSPKEKFALTEIGWDHWRELDAISSVAGGLPGSFEANIYASRLGLVDSNRPDKACRVLETKL